MTVVAFLQKNKGFQTTNKHCFRTGLGQQVNHLKN
jgi:hypothetical protein